MLSLLFAPYNLGTVRRVRPNDHAEQRKRPCLSPNIIYDKFFLNAFLAICFMHLLRFFSIPLLKGPGFSPSKMVFMYYVACAICMKFVHNINVPHKNR